MNAKTRLTILVGLGIAAIAIALFTLGGVPTDTTPIPRPMPPGGGGGGDYEPETPHMYFVFDKTTPADAGRALKEVDKQIDWMQFHKVKVGGIFSDRERIERYRDKVPAYEFRSVSGVLVADVTKKALNAEELKSLCDNLRAKLESRGTVYTRFLGKQSFTPVEMSDEVIFQLHDDMLSLFHQTLASAPEYTLVSVCSHENPQAKGIHYNAGMAATNNSLWSILVDSLDWRNMKIMSSLGVKPQSTMHLLVDKEGKIVGTFDKAEPTAEELDEFIKSSLTIK